MAQPGEIEQVVDQVAEAPAAGDDHGQVLPLLVGQRSHSTVKHGLADADDAVQRRAQLVRGVSEEFVLQRVCAQECLLSLLAQGDVPDNAGELPVLAAAADLAQRQLDREGRAVAALALELAANSDDPALAGLRYRARYSSWRSRCGEGMSRETLRPISSCAG